jgi:hypothetical protein
MNTWNKTEQNWDEYIANLNLKHNQYLQDMQNAEDLAKAIIYLGNMRDCSSLDANLWVQSGFLEI